MTLKEWAVKQPLKVARHPKYFNSFHVPDDARLVDRSEAWHLSDYRVTSVTGGTIWFSPIAPVVEEPPVVRCKVCGEDTTHNRESSNYGAGHRWGPTGHVFEPREK